MYNDLTWRHFETAAHAGVLADAQRGVAGSRAGGTWVQFDLQIEAKSRTLRCARFQAIGCPHVIAIADWIAAQAAGWHLQTALPASLTELQQRFAVPVEKRGRLLIIEDAWLSAVAAAEAAAEA